MPRSVEEGFKDFLVKLRATAIETEAAKRHRRSIESCLQNNFGLLRFTRIGSFGNGTSISGYSDVDYLACIPTNQLTQSSTYSLEKVKNALSARFPATGVRVNCPAITIPFGIYRSQTTEIVPADYIKDDDYKVYEIADGAGSWMRVSPDAHNAYVTYVDNKLGGKVKPLIRFLKAWKFFRDVPISSFYLEMRVAKYADQEEVIVYDIDVKNVLKSLWDSQLARIQDPMGFSGYISACKTDAQKEMALSKLFTAFTRAEKARQASIAENPQMAFDWWRLLYDDEFPTYYY
jgi:hypothetical protein